VRYFFKAAAGPAAGEKLSVTVRRLSAESPLLPVFLVFALLCMSPFIYFRF
jgi:hypothetical protein